MRARTEGEVANYCIGSCYANVVDEWQSFLFNWLAELVAERVDENLAPS